MTTETYLLYILLAAVAGMIYSLRRILILEDKIEILEERILLALGKRKSKPVAKKKTVRKKKVKRKKK